MRWRPGDLALIDMTNAIRDKLGLHGLLCELMIRVGKVTVNQHTITNAWHVLIDGHEYYVHEKFLRPPPAPSVKSTWARGVWRPSELHRIDR